MEETGMHLLDFSRRSFHCDTSSVPSLGMTLC